MTGILTEPVSGPNVWRDDELADAGCWIVRFSEEDFADFERALADVAKKNLKDVTEIRARDFPLPHFQERIDDIVDRLEHGLGLVLLRGLPIYDRFSEVEATIIYWGIGRHMGNLVPQNRKGDLVGQIRDLGRRGPYERAYATNEDLGFYTDSTDFVGLMCLRPALHGGESFVASSGLLYNFVVAEHPEYLPILHKNFPTDRRSEEPPGSPAGRPCDRDDDRRNAAALAAPPARVNRTASRPARNLQVAAPRVGRRVAPANPEVRHERWGGAPLPHSSGLEGTAP